MDTDGEEIPAMQTVHQPVRPSGIADGTLCLVLIRNTMTTVRARMTKIWTAVAERSGDTAFRTVGCAQKRRGASLPAAVHNPWLRRKPRWVYPYPSVIKIFFRCMDD